MYRKKKVVGCPQNAVATTGKEIQDSLEFWIPSNGFQIQIVRRIPDSLSCIPGSTSTRFPDSGIPYMRQLLVWCTEQIEATEKGLC